MPWIVGGQSSADDEISKRPLQKKNPGIACQAMKSPSRTGPTPALLAFSSWPPRTDARKLYASRRHGTFRWVLPRGWQAVAVVWSTLLITDLFLGLYGPALMAAVYIALCTDCSDISPEKPSWRAGGCALAGSALFFVSTNTAVWLLGTGYTPDASGLLASLSAGVPFWRNAIVGDILFSGVLFTAWAVAGHTTSSLRPLTHPKRILPDGLPA